MPAAPTIPLIPHSSNDSEDVQEDVDDVKVQVQRCEDVLLGGEAVLVLATHHELSVVHEIEGEEKRSQRRVHQREYVVANYHGDDSWKKIENSQIK